MQVFDAARYLATHLYFHYLTLNYRNIWVPSTSTVLQFSSSKTCTQVYLEREKNPTKFLIQSTEIELTGSILAMKLQEVFIVVASCIGFISVYKALTNFVRWVWVMFLRPPKNLKDYGSWAIVTGSAQGIGKLLAFELASKGLNLVLIDKNHSALEATSNEIHEEFGGKVEIKSMVFDLAKSSGEEIANAIEKGIRELDVGVLINNAGMAYPYARFFHEVDLELMENIIKVNLEAVTWVTRAVLPGMLKKKKGAIVNIASASAHLPSFPLYTLYSTTKMYVSMFSRCLSLEYKQQGIDIQCQTPLFVATRMTKHLKGPSWLMASPEIFCKASIRWIGYEPLCNPYWWHYVQWFISQASPDVLLNIICFQICIRIRKRGQMKELQMKKNASTGTCMMPCMY